MNSYGFVMVDRALLNRPEVRELSGPAFKTLVYLMAKHTGENNGQLPFSCREAGRLNGVTKQHGSNLLKELQSAGLSVTTAGLGGGFLGKCLIVQVVAAPVRAPCFQSNVAFLATGEVVKPSG